MADVSDPRAADRGPPAFALTLWPNRSLPRTGFKAILIFTAIMLSLPIIPILGTPVGFALLPFLFGTLLLLWGFIEWNYREGARLSEELCLWPDLITVVRNDPNGRTRRWEANPYWVKTALYKDGRVENYLTLKGNGREIELGAFLSPDERLSLRDDLDRALTKIRIADAQD